MTDDELKRDIESIEVLHKTYKNAQAKQCAYMKLLSTILREGQIMGPKEDKKQLYEAFFAQAARMAEDCRNWDSFGFMLKMNGGYDFDSSGKIERKFSSYQSSENPITKMAQIAPEAFEKYAAAQVGYQTNGQYLLIKLMANKEAFGLNDEKLVDIMAAGLKIKEEKTNKHEIASLQHDIFTTLDGPRYESVRKTLIKKHPEIYEAAALSAAASKTRGIIDPKVKMGLMDRFLEHVDTDFIKSHPDFASKTKALAASKDLQQVRE